MLSADANGDLWTRQKFDTCLWHAHAFNNAHQLAPNKESPRVSKHIGLRRYG